MEWSFQGEAIPDEISENLEGFVYLIQYKDGTKYIGKKNFFHSRKLPALKSGKLREGAERVGKNVRGKRVYFDLIKKETDWRTYNGSSKLCKGKEIYKKEILEVCYTKRRLTYLEVYYQMIYKVLEDETYLNDNILGKFYESVNEEIRFK